MTEYTRIITLTDGEISFRGRLVAADDNNYYIHIPNIYLSGVYSVKAYSKAIWTIKEA